MVGILEKIKIYLDNCCYNRPFDDQNQLRINIETSAKLFIQKLIVDKQVEMVWSYVLFIENYDNPFESRREAITDFSKNAVDVILENDTILAKAKEICGTGVKEKDSLHIACAIFGGCDYFITTDDRALKYRDDKIRIIDPIQFIKAWEGAYENE